MELRRRCVHVRDQRREDGDDDDVGEHVDDRPGALQIQERFGFPASTGASYVLLPKTESVPLPMPSLAAGARIAA